mgnify:CR=1 FL=1
MPAAKQLEFGGHALVWVGDWSPASARAAISSAARNGYDYIELAIFDPWNFDVSLTKDLLQEFNTIFKKGKTKIIPKSDYKVDKSLLNTRSDFDYNVPSFNTMIKEMKDWMIKYKKLYKYYDY